MPRRARALLAIALLAASLGPSVARAANPPLEVSVSILPLAWVVERIGGERVRTHVMIPPGTNPDTHAPTPRQLEDLARSQLWVLVGHPGFVFETSWVRPRLVDRPDARVVEMTRDLVLTGEDAGEDPHVWVSPRIMQSTVDEITTALCSLDPAHQADYRAGQAAFVSDLRSLDTELKVRLAGLQGGRFLVFHPAWGWFARDYGLVQIAIEREGKEPGPRQLIPLIEAARRAGVRVVFVQRGFSHKSAQIVATEIGAALVEVDPLARDWMANLRHVAEAFAQAIEGASAVPPESRGGRG